MKKRIFASSLFIIISVFSLLAVAFAADNSVKFEHMTGDMEEYAVITGIGPHGNVAWKYITGRYGLTDLTRVQEIGRYQDTYLFNENGTIVALDVNTGAVKWKNPDFTGSAIDETCHCFDNNGTLYLCGYQGPDFYAVNISGKTLGRIETFDSNYYWAGEIKKESKDIVAVGLEGSNYGEYSEENKYIFYVNLNDLSYSRSISELIIDTFHDVSKKRGMLIVSNGP